MNAQQSTGLARPAARGGLRYQLGMATAGFLGGLAIVVPAVLWLAADRTSRPPRSGEAPALLSEAAVASSGGGASLVSAKIPVQAERPAPAAATPGGESAKPASAEEPMLQSARASIRAGDIAGARRLLTVPELAAHGEALFMLAETYDPTVLAALGMAGLLADAQRARRYYEAAREHGMVAAVRRLEQLRP